MPETIEAEVISIDGKPPEPAPETGARSGSRGWGRERVRGTLLRLDRRWWPLWMVLGIVMVGLAVVFGLVLGLVYLVVASVRAVLRLFFGAGSTSGADGSSLRPR